MFAGIATGLVIFSMALPFAEEALGIFDELSEISPTLYAYTPMLLKIAGIAFVAEFAAQTLKDVGESGIASRVEFGGKVMILAICAPVVMDLVNDALGLLGAF